VARSVVERARPALCSRPEDSRMDGRGRMIDNIFIERLWRTVKYEEDYLKDYKDVLEAVSNLKSYFAFYNHDRLHQALGYQTPAAIYFGKVKQ
jgi:putative transposase